MAHEESPREDLLREATALVERIELVPRAEVAETTADDVPDRTIVAGFRFSGAVSIFFGESRVYHFNAAGELRRAYLEGRLYKAVKGELVALTRVRTAEQVELRSRILTTAEHAAFIDRMSKSLASLAAGLATDNFEAHRKVPQDADVLHRLHAWLTDHPTWTIAARPNA